jgi:hypothetical protein
VTREGTTLPRPGGLWPVTGAPSSLGAPGQRVWPAHDVRPKGRHSEGAGPSG